ncbi:MAG: DNA translocase FtsK, partial [Chloroflexota bacterium]|nr:DNA translocase FtsK [Chloroflexota bacterium]
ARGRAASSKQSASRRRFSWPWPELKLGAALRRDIIAVALVVLALLTLWSLFGGRGGLLGLWGEALRRAFGWAAILVPLALLAWTIDAFRQDPVAPFGPRRRHVLGTVLLFVAILGLLHLPAPDLLAWGREGKGGGSLGYLVASPLVALLRVPGAALVLLGLATVALVVTLNTDLRSLGRGLKGAAGKGWRALRRSGAAAKGAIEEGTRTRGEGRDKSKDQESANARPRAASGGDAEERPEGDEDDGRGPVINLPQPGSKGESKPATAEEIGLQLGHKLRALLDEPAPPPEPLVVGTGQLPLPADGQEQAAGAATSKGGRYRLPPLTELPLYDSVLPNGDELSRKARRIEETLTAFKVEARVREINPGAAVTQFALEPGTGVKVRSIKALENDLALALAASSITIETPIPGQSRVGIVIPNKTIARVGLRETMESPEFTGGKAKLPVALGRDVNARYIVADLARMPHLLIAGSTGSGKSVCLNSIISTFLLTRTPDELKMVMIDPKMVELVGYNGIPHLKGPVVIEMDKVVGTLRKALSEMERRYALFSKLGVRNIDGYRERRAKDPTLEGLPYLVVIIDELADLMMTAPDEVETTLVRLAQMARATGIHLIIATQRPSVDVLTGLIKANFPARIAFAVTSQIDSRVILDAPGAERLLGRGDMLFQDPTAAKPVRVQGTFVDDPDIERLVQHWAREVPAPQYDSEWVNVPAYRPGGDEDEDGEDPMLKQALAIVQQHGTASASMLQRRLRIGYNRAARLIEQLEEEGYIGPSEGARGRTVLGTRPRDEDDFIDNASIPFDDE